MNMFKAEPQEFTGPMSRFDGGELFRFTQGNGPRGLYDGPGPAPQAPRYRTCLDCALPLHMPGEDTQTECRCLPPEEADEDWLAISGVELTFIIGLALACVTAGFWFWFWL